MRIPGIHCENTRRIVHRALDGGWEYDGVTKGGHGQLRWQPDAVADPVLLFFGLTPSDRNAWRKLARDIEAASGVVVWRQPSHRPGRGRTVAVTESKRVQRDRARFEQAAAEKAAAHRRAVAEREARARVAQVAAAADERRRFFTALMMPGNGR